MDLMDGGHEGEGKAWQMRIPSGKTRGYMITSVDRDPAQTAAPFSSSPRFKVNLVRYCYIYNWLKTIFWQRTGAVVQFRVRRELRIFPVHPSTEELTGLLRVSRIKSIKPGDRLSFRHNNVADLKRVLKGVRDRPITGGN
jgi:hypothetical protein